MILFFMVSFISSLLTSATIRSKTLFVISFTSSCLFWVELHDEENVFGSASDPVFTLILKNHRFLIDHVQTSAK